MPDPKLVNVRADGRTYAIPEAEVEEALRQGYTLESADAKYDRLTADRLEEEYGGVTGKIAAGGAGVLRGATLGLSDVAFDALGESEDFRNLRDVNPGASLAGEVVGGVATAATGVGPAGAAAKLGSRVARTAEGAGVAAKVGRAVAGGAVEGAITGAGAAVSELALSEQPLTIERAASSLSSNMLYGGAIGGGVGGVTKGVELGLSKASKAMREYADKAAAVREAPEVAEDLAGLDAKGLRAARETELATIETARVPQRQALADELSAFRTELKESKLWLATKGAEERELREIGKLSLEADRAVDRVLRNPKNLASNPKAALAGLQQQEHALELLAKQSDNLRVKFAADTSGERIAALDAVVPALERNRAMQAKISELTSAPSSARLVAIDDAKDALSIGKREKSMPEQMLQGSVFSMATGAASFLGPLAPLVGAKAARLVTDRVFGGLGKAATEAATKSALVASSFLDTAAKGVRASAPIATRVLASVSYAPSTTKATEPRPKKGTAKQQPKLAEVYKARSEELRSQTAYGPDGSVVMRPEARAAMAARLAPIRAANPVLADRLETHAAKRLEYVASKLPRRPDMGVMPVGPDLWQPSDMEMRSFARCVAAAEDPAGVEQRLVDGTLTPEDADTYRELYPERFAALRNDIIGRLGELRAQLPYERRLSLSIFTGVPVDPAMHPQVLAVLQGSFAAEEGTEGGVKAPTPQPQFGSVRSEPATPAQQREQGV